MTDALWSADDLAAFLNVPRSTIYHWSHRREGPPAFKVGRVLRFDPDAVREWLEDQRIQERTVGRR